MRGTIPIRIYPLAIVVLAIFCAFANLSLAGQENSDQEPNSLDQWVSQLTDDSPAKREKAELEILKSGEDALPAIKRGLQNGNLEIHDRCRILLERIERRRKKKFSKDFLDLNTSEEEIGQLNAWPKFRKFAGEDDVLHRKLFLSMCEKIPLLFDNYNFRSQLTAPALKQSARMALVPDKHINVSADLLLMSYLFVAGQARIEQAEDSSASALFNSVEVLEAVNFISNPENASVVRNSEYRLIIDEAVASWLNMEVTRDGFPDETKWNLIYQTGNAFLIDQLESRYNSFEISEKLKFLAIVLRAANVNDKSLATRCLKWLSKPMADDSKVLKSRYRKRPAQTVDVTLKMLADAVAAKVVNREAEESEKIELEKIFGDFPLSASGYSILKGEEGVQKLSQRLLTRQSGEM